MDTQVTDADGPASAGPRRGGAGRVLVAVLAVIGALAVVIVLIALVVPAPGPVGGSGSTGSSNAGSSYGAAQQSGPQDSRRFLEFGSSYTLPSGAWEVRASAPRAHTPTANAAGGEGAERYIRVDITVTNRTDRYVNVSDEWVATLGVDGSSVPPVYDVETAGAASGFPPNRLAAPGQSVTWGVVWPLADAPATLQLGLDPRSDPSGWSHVAWQGDDI